MKWKNINQETSTFFITATITDWQPLFQYDPARTILLEDFEFYRRKYAASIHAYVIMPEHYHMALTLNTPDQLHNWLRDIQSHTSNELSRWIRRTMEPTEYEVFARHANGTSKLAVWKEQARAVGLISEAVTRVKVEYIHANPVRRGLVNQPEEWPWSSWRNYYGISDVPLTIDPIML